MRLKRNITSSKAQKGFNLIEAAIVLGIVGLVIGGIWTAASAARLSFQVNELQKGILQSCQAASQLIPAALVPATLPNSWERMNTKGLQMGIFPKSWKLTNIAGDTDFYLETEIGFANTRIFDRTNNPPGNFDMMFTMPRAACVRLVRGLAGLNMPYYLRSGGNASPLNAISVWTCDSAAADASCVMQPSQGAATLFQFGETDIDAVVALCSTHAAVSMGCRQ